jgi:hypothetical protein
MLRRLSWGWMGAGGCLVAIFRSMNVGGGGWVVALIRGGVVSQYCSTCFYSASYSSRRSSCSLFLFRSALH